MKKTPLLLLICLSIFLSACSAKNTAPVINADSIAEVTPSSDGIVAEGNLLPSPALGLSFPQAGQLAEFLIKPGDVVAQGDLLARLIGSESVEAEKAAALREQLLAQQALNEMNRNALSNDAVSYQMYLDARENYDQEANGWNLGNIEKASALQLAIDDYVDAEERYQDARDNLQKYMFKDESDPLRKNAQDDLNLEKNKLTTAYENLLVYIPNANDLLETRELEMLKAIGDLETARNQLGRFEQGMDQEVLAIAQARLDYAATLVLAAEEVSSYYLIRAPFAGTVLSDNQLIEGEIVSAGQPVLYLGDINHWIVETIDLAEIDITEVRVGNTASVKFDGIPGEVFSGTVTEIDPVGRDYLGDNTYQVTISMDEADPRFLWNMTATITIAK